MARKFALLPVPALLLAVVLGGCRPRAGADGIRLGATSPQNDRRDEPVAIDGYGEIIVTDFAESAPVAELSLGRKLAEYLEVEVRRTFKGKVSRLAVPAEPVAAARDREFWKSAGSGLDRAVFLAGTVGLVGEAQKALKEADVPKDGPFKLGGHGLAERKRFTLSAEIVLIDAATGETLRKTEIKETRTYGDVELTAEFALADFLPIIKTRLFRALFGREPVEERHLFDR